VEGHVKVDGNFLLCKEHYNKYLGDKKLAEIEDLVNKIKSLDNQLETELKVISNDFFILIKEPIYFLNLAKEKFVREHITSQMFAAVTGGSIIDTFSVLSPTENNEWRGIYNPNDKMEDICQAERNFLIGLAENHKSKSDAEKSCLAEKARKKAEAETKKEEELKKNQKEKHEKRETEENEQKKMEEKEENKKGQENNSNNGNEDKPNFSPISDNSSSQTDRDKQREREREREIPTTRPRRTSHAKIPIMPN
jgi:hypothetical protein